MTGDATVKNEIRLEDAETKGRYVYQADGGPEAELIYSKAGQSRLIIEHTEVPDFYRGKGIGVALVERIVEDARAAGKTVLPLCPYAAAQFRRHPEWGDVVDRFVHVKGQDK